MTRPTWQPVLCIPTPGPSTRVQSDSIFSDPELSVYKWTGWDTPVSRIYKINDYNGYYLDAVKIKLLIVIGAPSNSDSDDSVR